MVIHEDESKRVQFPLGSGCYQLLEEIGQGASAVVYKANCVPMNSAVVAIKVIDLDQSRADFDAVRREAKMLALLSHPNILNAHCSFTVGHRLWVVMPYMDGGSLLSLISHSFPGGLPETCIAVVLKEILNALFYLHGQGHLHRDIKAGNILIDSNGLVKLADFGVSTSIYESHLSAGLLSSSSCPSLMLKDFAGTPYWMAPEVIHSHTGYSFKADIWSFGITALELAHGRPPLSHLPPSKSMMLKMTKRFRFSDLAKHNRGDDGKKFSKPFKNLVGACLHQDPSKRPTAEKLLNHPFFKNCKGNDYLAKTLLQGLPSVEERYRKSKILYEKRTVQEDEEGHPVGQIVKQRRISGWNFNEDGLEFDPVFPAEPKEDEIVKQVQFGGEMIINERLGDDLGESEDTAVAVAKGVYPSEPVAKSGAMNQSEGVVGSGRIVSPQREHMLSVLAVLKESLVQQLAMVKTIQDFVAGSEDLVITEECMARSVQMLDIEVANAKRKNMALQLQLNRIPAAAASANAAGGAVKESAFGGISAKRTFGDAAEESALGYVSAGEFADVSAVGSLDGSSEESAFGDVSAEETAFVDVSVEGSADDSA
ncbi:hypothetical protein L6164_025796 [Bauhinia variegata]|uniref:Uncharacterized protein n=2 Tax=Bauhinia variegata TaxID=167791 RepID=A0ACB9M3L1_BAUVA|nr:hypothetical protein L6164_025796 [Bauhinia variegata]